MKGTLQKLQCVIKEHGVFEAVYQPEFSRGDSLLLGSPRYFIKIHYLLHCRTFHSYKLSFLFRHGSKWLSRAFGLDFSPRRAFPCPAVPRFRTIGYEGRYTYEWRFESKIRAFGDRGLEKLAEEAIHY